MTSPRLSILCLIFILASLVESRAESIVSEGFRRFNASGSTAAVETWSRQSRLLDPNKIALLTAELKKWEASLGSFNSFEFLDTQALGTRNSQTLAVAHFRYGSLFFRFLVFQDALGQEYVNGIWFSSDPLEVLPEKSSDPGRLKGKSRF